MQSAFFLSRLGDIKSRFNLEDPLFRLRQQAWDRFLEVSLPTGKTETYQYIKLRKLYSKELAIPVRKALEKDEVLDHIFPECRHSFLVFVNGYFIPEISEVPKGVEILPLSEAIFSYHTYLNNQWSRTQKEEKDPFALLNGALFNEGAMIYLAPKATPTHPLQLLFITTESNTFANPRVELFLGKESEIKVVSRHVALQPGSFTNAFTNCVLNEGSKLTYTQSVTDIKDSWVFDAIRGHLKRDASLTTVMATSGSETIRHDYQVELAGENGSVHLNGLWMLKENREAHVHVLMKHSAPNCYSLQLFKGTLNDASRSSFEGKIYVEQAAQKTDSFQLNNNLLLSNNAQANSKPNLEIFADDVKASHGSTFGQLDPEEIFYLKTRGFETTQATNLLTKAFLREVIDKIEIPSLRNALVQRSSEFLG